MSSGERPIGAAKGKQSDTEALCQPPPPTSLYTLGPVTLCGGLVLLDAANRPEKGDPWEQMILLCSRRFCLSLWEKFWPEPTPHWPKTMYPVNGCPPPPPDGMLGLGSAVYGGEVGVSSSWYQMLMTCAQGVRESRKEAGAKSSSSDIGLMGTVLSGSSRSNRDESLRNGMRVSVQGSPTRQCTMCFYFH